jgi:hypothetical protein
MRYQRATGGIVKFPAISRRPREQSLFATFVENRIGETQKNGTLDLLCTDTECSGIEMAMHQFTDDDLRRAQRGARRLGLVLVVVALFWMFV